MTRPEDLDDIRNLLFKKAEFWWGISLILAVAMLAFSIAVLLIDSARLIAFSGLLGMLLPVVITWSRETSTANMIKADKCRRLILFSDGLDEEIPPNELAQVRAWAIGNVLEGAPYVKPYYSSEKSPGPRRLADILTESAYFTEYLASKLKLYLVVLFVASLVVAIVILSLADVISGAQHASLILIAKSVSVFIAFLISGDFLLLAKKFGDLRQSANEIFMRCARLRETEDISRHEIQCLADDYSVALLQAAPIPSWLYQKFRDSLNRAYRDSHIKTAA
jgi:hypothetical protein